MSRKNTKRIDIEKGTTIRVHGKKYVVADIDEQHYYGGHKKRWLKYNDRKGERWADQDDVEVIQKPVKEELVA